jgi:hypothetical protein
MSTSYTPRFSLPVPTWNADWQKWQQVFETFATGVDSNLFSIMEHVTLIPRVLPTVSITGGVFAQSGPAQFVSRTLQVEIGVGPNALTLVPRALVCAHLQSGAVGPQSIEWELRITSTEVDADLVVLGVVGDDYAITWFNGARLVPGTPMPLFAFAGGGGAGSLQDAYDGGASIAIPSGGDPVRIDNGASGAPALALGGSGPQRVTADDELELADGNYTGVQGPAEAIPLTSVGARDFTFACASLVDAINQAHASGGGGLDPAPFATLTANTVLTPAQNGQYFLTYLAGGTVQVTLPTNPTDGMQYTVVAGPGTTTHVVPGGTNVIVLNGEVLTGIQAVPGASMKPHRVTVTAKNVTALGLPVIAWIVADGEGTWSEVGGAHGVNLSFPVQVSTATISEENDSLVGTHVVGSVPSLVTSMNVTPYNLRRNQTTYLVGTSLSVGQSHVRSVIESYHTNASVVDVPITLDTGVIAGTNDEGWTAIFRVGHNASGLVVPIVVQNQGVVAEISIEGARFVHSLRCEDAGGFIIIHYSSNTISTRGKFVVLAGRGTWTDDLGGVHYLSGGGGGAGSLQDAYDGGAEIAIPSGGDPVTIQNEDATGAALYLTGTGPQRVAADGELELADGGYLGVEGPPDAVPLTDAGARDFLFPCASLVDAINQAYLGVGAVTWSGESTNDTPKEIFVGGVPAARYELSNGSTVSFRLTALARDNVGNRSKVWDIVAVAQCSTGGTVSWVSVASPSYAVVDQSDSSGGTDDWDLALSLNVPDSTLRVTVTGQTSTTVQWAVFNR